MEYETDVADEGPKLTIRAGLRLVWSLVRPHGGPFSAAVFGAMVFAGGTVVSAEVLGWIVDTTVIPTLQGDRNATRSDIFGAIAAVLAVAVIRSIAVVARRFFAGMTSERVERSARRGLADQYLAQPISWLRSVPSGRLIAHVDSDIRTLTEPLAPLPFSIGVVFLMIFSTISLVLIDVYVAIVALAVFPIVLVAGNVYSRFVEKPLERTQQGVADAASIAHESFEGAQIVKTLGRRTQEVDKFAAAADRLRGHRVKAENIKAVFDTSVAVLPALTSLAVVVVGAFRIRSGDMTAGDIVQVSALLGALAVPMLVFGFLLEGLIPSVVAWNRLEPVLKMSPPRDGSESVARFVEEGLPVEVRGLRYAYPDAPDELVIDGVDLSVAPGEMLAVVGPTGSGKSTMCAALAGVLDGVDGVIKIGGSNVGALSTEERLAAVSLVFQEPFMFAESILSNVLLGTDRSIEEVVAACELAEIDDWISSLPAAYDTVLGERGATVSGGQRQRLALARALIRRARVVILDDATSAIDTVIEQRILSHLRSSTGATLIVVAHRLSTIVLADRVAYFRDGSVVAVGTHERLLADSQYSAMVNAYSLDPT